MDATRFDLAFTHPQRGSNLKTLRFKALGAVVLTGLLLPAGAASAASTCEPFEPTQQAHAAVASAKHGTLGGRPAHTAYLNGGAYTTTRCDANGVPQRAVTMAPQRLPDGTVKPLPVEIVEQQDDGRTLVTTATRGDLRLLDGDWRTVVARAADAGLPPLDKADVTKARPPQLGDEAGVKAAAARAGLARTSRHHRIRFARGSARPATTHGRALARAAAFGDKCTNPWYTADGYRWPYGWRFWVNWDLLGAQFRDVFTREMVKGVQSWQFGTNDCGWWSGSQIVPVVMVNWTSHPAASPDGATAYKYGDGVIDFGGLTAGPCGGAIACTWRWRSTANQTNTVANVRLSSAYPYTAGWYPGYYDIWSVIAHETGHAMGLGDLYDSYYRWTTMYGYGMTNDITKRYLARGEYLYINALY